MKVPLVDLKAQYHSLKEEMDKAIWGVLESTRFILGEEGKGLEEEISAFCNAKFAVGVSSGTDALLLSLIASGIEAGDEVITVPFTFFATTEVISQLSAKPVFVDIDPRTFNIDASLIKEKISNRTRAIIPVHLFGQTADMDPIWDLAKEIGLIVIEDAAQAIGAEYRGGRVGSYGDKTDAVCLSFFPSKTLGAYGDAGMVVTDKEDLAEKVMMLRTHGSTSKYYYSWIGYNSRLDELQAAILRVKLKRLDEWIKARRRSAHLYNELLAEVEKVVTPIELSGNKHIYNYYTIRAEGRDELRDYLKSKEIATAIYYPLPLHLQEVYKSLGYKEGDFPVAERAAKEVLSLPMYPELTEEQIKFVADSIKEFHS